MLQFVCFFFFWVFENVFENVVLALQELRKDGFDLAEARYRELKPILDEVEFFWHMPENSIF